MLMPLFLLTMPRGISPGATGIVLACLLALAAGRVEAARLALVIGNDQYQVLGKLGNAAKDARDVAAELRAAGFQVPDKWVVQNGTRNSMRAALQDFVGRLKPEDEVVFYYSGHGVEIDAQAALVPVDLNDPSRNPLDGSLRPLADVDLAKQQVLDESITLNRVAADIAGRGVKFSLLIVDACRDNPILELLKKAHVSSPLKNAGAAPAAGLIADSVADSQVLLFSASKGQQSLDRLSRDDPEKNGVFTRVLLKAMRTPGLGLRDMLPLVKAEVKALAATVRIGGRPHVQEPRSMASYDAPNFHFRSIDDLSALARPAPAPMPAPAAPTVRVASPDEVEQQLWDLIKDSRDIQDFKDYLQRYPSGRFASLAARQVRVLSTSQPVQLATAVPEPARPAPDTRRATERRVGDVFKDCNDCPEMVVVSAGVFTMGARAGESTFLSNGPPRQIKFGSDFAMGRYEITVGEFRSFVTATNFVTDAERNIGNSGCLGDDWKWQSGLDWRRPGFEQSDRHPVICVSWNDAQAFSAWLSKKSNQKYRLPSEAEWEYAARAGNDAYYPWGEDPADACRHANVSDQTTITGWRRTHKHECRDGYWFTAPVGSFELNRFGMADMIGNVNEWVQDCYDHKAYAGKAPVDGRALEVTDCQTRSTRGGAFDYSGLATRVYSRSYEKTVDRQYRLGFRVVRVLR